MSKDEGPDNPETIRHLFNRSPHPYHRPSFNSSERFTPYPSAKSKSQSSKDPGKNGTGNFIRSNTSPSDSGTEADDEKPILRALTAPPIRPRKGLKGLSLNDDITDSVPTQYGIEDDKTRLLAGHAILERKKSGKQEILKRNKGSERPGLEFTRRVSECIIFGCICGISLYRLDSEAMTGTNQFYQFFQACS